MKIIFINLITELQKDLINIILIVLPARKIEKLNGGNKMLNQVIKKEDNKNIYLLKAAVNAVREHRGQPELKAGEFLKLVREKLKVMQMDEAFLHRNVNEGFSGGEKKRNEILQMQLLEPTLALLDETDSGLDVDALRIVGEGINQMRSPDRSVLLVTHYQRLLDVVKPDFVHVLAQGEIKLSGDHTLAQRLEREGYEGIEAA